MAGTRLLVASTANDTGPDGVDPGLCIFSYSWGSSSSTDVGLTSEEKSQ